MENYTTQKQKRNVKQISVFVLPEEKLKIDELAKGEFRSTSSYCKSILLKKINSEDKR